MLFKVKNFTMTPGGRFIRDGKFSGEEFRENVLDALYNQALETDETLEIDLDGTYGYPSSFLEESFGGLARKYGKQSVKNKIKVISNDDPLQICRIQEYIENCDK